MDTTQTPPPGGVLMFLPLMIYTAIILGMVIYLINKKGKSMVLILPALIPFVNAFVMFYLFAQTNKDVLEDLRRIKEQLGIQ
jgi:uncharacterized membrane protein (GlpM family)